MSATASPESIVNLNEALAWRRLDAEFWRREYVDAFDVIKRWRSAQSLGAIARRMRKGIFYILADEYVSSGVPFLRVSNLRGFVVDPNNLVFITSERNSEESKTSFGADDLVISKTGEPGAALVGLPQANISQDLIGIEIADPRKHSPSYVVAFLNSVYGLLQMGRWFQGQVQMHLALSDAKAIVVPFPRFGEQSRVANLVQKAQRERELSREKYLAAEALLLKNIAWKRFEERDPPSSVSTRSLAQTSAVARLDAEYFQPKYDDLDRHLKRTGPTKPLASLTTVVRRGKQPAYSDDGTVLVINSQHLGQYLVDVQAAERTDPEFYERHVSAQLRPGDVLFYSTGAYIGRTNLWLASDLAIASNHVTIIRTTKDLDPGYLAVFLNSPPGRMQAERWATGSGQREVFPEALSRFTVSVPPRPLQSEVSRLLKECSGHRKRASGYAAEAIGKVEEIVRSHSD